MQGFKFVSHEAFPEDQYIKELVYLSFEDKYRVAYVRKIAKNGGKFWDVASIGITKDGNKKYFDTFMQDSSFLEKDIMSFLENRNWIAAKSNDEIPF